MAGQYFCDLTLFLLHDLLQCKVSQERNYHVVSEETVLSLIYAKLFKVICNIQALWTKFYVSFLWSDPLILPDLEHVTMISVIPPI
jgi:hypothetical protein